MKVFIPHIQLKIIQEDLLLPDIQKIASFNILREYFDFPKHIDSIHPPSLPKQYYSFFTQLQQYTEKNKSLQSQKVHVILEEQCKDCQLLLIEKGQKKCVIPFRQNGWAEIEEFLLVSGLIMIHSHDIEKTMYLNKNLNVVYEIFSYSEGSSYLAVEAETIDQIIAGLTLIGLSIDKTKEIPENTKYEYDLSL